MYKVALVTLGSKFLMLRLGTLLFLGVLLFLGAPLASVAADEHATRQAGPYSVEFVGITSAFFVRSGGAVGPGFECTVGARKGPLRITHSFGVGGGGEVWQHSGLVVMLSGHVEARTKPAPRVALRIRLADAKMPFEQQPGSIYIGALTEPVHSPMHWEVHGRKACPPQFCLMPQPEVALSLSAEATLRGQEGHSHSHGHSSSSSLPEGDDAADSASWQSPSSFAKTVEVAAPHCGWAPPFSALTFQPERGNITTLDVDISHWLAQNISAFKVWAVPITLGEAGMWQTKMLSLSSLTLREEELGGETII